jgi:hypothetical protein
MSKTKALYLFIILMLALGSTSPVLAAAAADLAPQDAGAITNYTFSATSGTFTPLSGGTAVDVIEADQQYSGALPLGFDFWYMGVRYTQVYASSNGWLSFTAPTDSTAFNNLTSSAPRPLVAPLWDDLSGTTVGSASYQTSGSAPNQVFTMEWLNWKWNYQAADPVISFQVKLYEGTGAVEFVYREEAGVVNNGSASIGIDATATGSGTFWSLNDTSPAPIPSSTTETSALNTRPATGQVYTFTPPSGAPNAPTGLNFTAITISSMTLNWTDNSADEVGFAILRSTDGINYTYITTTAADAISSVQGGLLPNTLYYWQIYAVKEGTASTPLSGSQSTAACTLTGARTVGPTGDYATITAAIADITNNLGLAGPVVLELQSTYTSGGETFPITIGPLPCADATNTLTVRPQTGATALSISSSATATIDLNGGSYVTFDGQPGGTGGAKELTIANTATAGCVRFINDASYNTLQYLRVQG